MAKTDNLIHYLSDIANAIREKEGSTDPINAQDFSEKIKSMSGSSGNEIQYYKINWDFIDSQHPDTINQLEPVMYLPIIDYKIDGGLVVSRTLIDKGSGDIQDLVREGLAYFMYMKKLLGLSILKGKLTTIMFNDASSVEEISCTKVFDEDFSGDIAMCLISVLEQIFDVVIDDPEQISQMTSIYNQVFVPITKEEYYNLQ